MSISTFAPAESGFSPAKGKGISAEVRQSTALPPPGVRENTCATVTLKVEHYLPFFRPQGPLGSIGPFRRFSGAFFYTKNFPYKE